MSLVPPKVTCIAPHVASVLPQVAPIPAGFAEVSLAQVAADLATIPAYLAQVLAAIAAVVAQLAADGVGGSGGLSGSECRGAGNQREGQHDEAASHGHVLLRSADQTQTRIRC